VGPVTTFRSGAALGEIVQINVIVPGLTPDYTAATCSAAFWDNSSGLYPTWAQASVAWEAGLIAANCAPLENVLLTAGGGTYQPMTLNLGFVPEPAAVVLVGVGVSCLIFSRRRR
jgi:hypothetical protein